MSLRISRRKFCRGAVVATFIISCATFVASIIFWVRGSSRMDELSFNRFDGPYPFQGVWQVKQHRFAIDSTRGRIGLLFIYIVRTDRERNSGILSHLGKPVEWRHWDSLNLLEHAPEKQFLNKFGFFVGLERNDSSDFLKKEWALFDASFGKADFWIVFPNWALALVSLLFATLSYRYLRPRIGKGQCANCGYDLRATPDRCPECGTAAKHEFVLKSVQRSRSHA